MTSPVRFSCIPVKAALRALVCGAAALLAGMPGIAAAHGTFHDLMQELGRKIELQPDDASLYLRRADVYLEHGEWQPCLVEVERVDRMAPGKFATDLTRGRAWAAAGRWELSRLALDAFLVQHEGNPLGLLERARACKALKDEAACLSDYRQALERAGHPEPDLFNEVAEALWLSGHKDEAIHVLDRGLKALGGVPQLIIKVMQYEIGTMRYDQALSRIDIMQQSMPRPEPWMARRASVLAQAGRFAESRAAWIALIDRIKALPNLDRGSNAMCLLMEQAQTAIVALSSLSQSSFLQTKP